jgi:hypothetical protein
VNEGPAVVLLLAVSAAFIGVAVWMMVNRRPSQVDEERRRRALVNARGRMVDGSVTDIHDTVLSYSYTVRGMTYIASQDVAALRHLLPEDLSATLGPVTVKYSSDNPANSIVICESWSGLRG